MHDANSSFISASHSARWGEVPAAPWTARPVRDSSGLGAHHSDDDLRGFRPLEEDPLWRMPRSSHQGSALEIGKLALLALLAVIAIRMLMAQ